MNITSKIIGIISFILMAIGLVPLLGIINWIVIPLTLIGILIGAISKKESGMILNGIVLIVAIVRLSIGGGIF